MRWTEPLVTLAALLLPASSGVGGESPAGREAAPAEVRSAVFPENVARHLRDEGAWLPIYLELAGRGEDGVPVTIEARVSRSASRSEGSDRFGFTTRRTVEVAGGGAPRREWVYLWVPPSSVPQEGRLEVSARGRSIYSGVPWILQTSDDLSDAFTTVVASDGSSGSPWGESLLDPDEPAAWARGGFRVTSSSVSRLRFEQLPDSFVGYHGVDLVVLRGGASPLGKDQESALRQWVALGGFLVLVPGDRQSSSLTIALARRLLGDVLGELRTQVDFEPLGLYGNSAGEQIRAVWPRGDPASPESERRARGRQAAVTAVRIDPFLQGALLDRSIRSTNAPPPRTGVLRGDLVYGERKLGAGRVGLLTVDDEAPWIESHSGLRRALWRHIADPLLTAGRSHWREQASVPVAETARLLRGKRDVGVWIVAVLLLAYVLIAGPGVYLFLKRRNRLLSFIWVEPIIIVLYLGIVLTTGYLSQGVLTKVRLVTIFQQKEGEALSVRDTYLTLFSAQISEYRIECPGGGQLRPLLVNEEESQHVLLVERSGGAGGERASVPSLEGYRLNKWQEGFAVNTGFEDLGLGVVLEKLDRQPDPRSGGSEARNAASSESLASAVRVKNLLPYALREGWIRRGNQTRRTGPIPPGGEVVVRTNAPGETEVSGLRATDVGEEVVDVSLSILYNTGSFTSKPVFVGLLERTSDDFRVDKPHTVAYREDVYALFR